MAPLARLDPRIRRALGKRALVRAGELFKLGVHPRTVYGLRDAGELEQVSRGVFRLANTPLPPHLDLLAVAARAPHAVVCLISALAFHELTDEIPHEVSIAVLRGATAPTIDYPPVRTFHFAAFAHGFGIEHHKIEGIGVKVYGAAKSVVDAFRFRNRIGEDVAIRALAAGLRSRRVRPGSIIEMAKKLRIGTVISPYVKALT